jgi:hypothetical protein
VYDFKMLEKKSALHLRRSSEGWGNPEPLGQLEAQSVQEGGRRGVWTDDAT